MSDNKEFNSSMRLTCPEELTKNRFVQESGLSKEDAKRIALKHNVIWDVE